MWPSVERKNINARGVKALNSKWDNASPAPLTGRGRLSNYSQLATIQKEIPNIYKTICRARNETASKVHWRKCGDFYGSTSGILPSTHNSPISVGVQSPNLLKKCVSLEIRINCRASLVVQVVKNLACQYRRPSFDPSSRGRQDPLEKGMATHSSVVGWRLPWTEEPGGLQSMGLNKSDTTYYYFNLFKRDASARKESACNAGDTGDTSLTPGSGRSPGGGNGNLLQHSCLENPMHRGAWRATVHGL